MGQYVYRRRIAPGSVLEVQATVGLFSVPHPGVLAYTDVGQPVVVHNSKRYGQPVIEAVSSFAEGQTPTLTYQPSSTTESEAIVRAAVEDMNRGDRWAPWNNCQHFANRAVTGRDVSATWTGIVIVGCVGAVLGIVLLSKN